MTSNELKLKVSGGLFVLAAIHALTMAMVLVMAQPQQSQPKPQANTYSNYFPGDQLDEIFYQGPKTASSGVNLTAQDELKQNILDEPKEQCIACPPLPAQPTYRQPVQYPQAPTLAPALPSNAVPIARPSTPAAPAVVKKYQFMLFYDSSEQSKQILDWMRNDPRFVNMRKGSSVTSVQYYAADNPLYKTRFAKAIPADQFPVIVLTDADGGHIHAAGGNFIPPTVDQLYADMSKALELYTDARQNAPAQGLVGSGAIKTFGYSFNPNVSPQQRLVSYQQNPEDCPDGICPDDNYDPSPSGGGLFDRVRDKVKPKSIVTWASGGEYAMIAAAGVLGLVVLMLAFALYKRLSK
jgi:hypothetical protein